MITRRRFLATIGVNLLATPLALEAQQPVRVHRIGFLAGPTLPTSDSVSTATSRARICFSSGELQMEGTTVSQVSPPSSLD